jgi:hypothetical protein
MRRSYHRRNKFEGQFAGRLRAMLESPAYRVLTLAAHRLLSRIEIELCKQAGENNSKLIVTYEQFIEYGIHKDAIAPAIREVEALGFVEAEHGQAGNREYHWPSTYRLTYHSVGRAKPTHEWKRFDTIEKAKASARAARGPAPRRKQKAAPGIRESFAPGNQGRKPKFPPPESGGNGPPPESMGTSRLSGEGLDASRAQTHVAPPPRQSAARAPPEGRHKRGPVLMQGGTPASPDATNETLTTARGGSAHQKEENGQ